MQDLSYVLFLTLMHSLWQSALLLGIYHSLAPYFRNRRPLEKRDFLLAMLLLQLTLSVITLGMLSAPETPVYFSLFQWQEIGWLKRLSPGLCMVYFSVAVFRLAGVLMRFGNLRNPLLMQATPAPAVLRAFTDWQAQSFRIGRKVTVWVSDHITSPLTYGFLKPVILLPAAVLNRLSLEETEAIIIHELNHIRNQDFLINAGMLVIECIYFFNPAMLIIIKHIRLEREKDCDLRVLNFKYSPSMYAETLLKLAIHSKQKNIQALPLTGEKAQLLKRIRFISNADQHITEEKSYKRLILLAITCMMLLTMGPLRKDEQKAVMAEKTVRKETLKVPFISPHPLQAFKHESEKVKSAEASKKPNRKKNTARKSMNRAAGVKSPDFTANDPAPMADARYASYRISDTEKMVLTEEEESGGNKVVKCYKFVFENNRWESRLIWTLISRTIDTSHAF